MARASARTAKSKTAVKVDFTGVEANGKVAEGRCLLTVDGVPEIKKSESGNDYINVKFKAPGGVLWHTCSLQPQALFNLRNTMESLGMEVAEELMEIDLTEWDGLTCGGEVEHESYGGKKRARIVDLFPEAELEESEEEEEEETPKPKTKGKKEAEPEPEEEELTYEDLAEASKEELLEIAKDNDVEGITLKLKKDLEALRAHIAKELELEAPAEEEEESEDPTYESVQEMDKEELVALVKEHEIEGVTLKLKKDLAAFRDHVCTALELEGEEEEEEAKPTTSRRKKTGSAELKVGSNVTFVDDGEDMEGKVKSINTKEKFAVVLIGKDEWEVELSDLTVA